MEIIVLEDTRQNRAVRHGLEERREEGRTRNHSLAIKALNSEDA
jgi:hypothetical protein